MASHKHMAQNHHEMVSDYDSKDMEASGLHHLDRDDMEQYLSIHPICSQDECPDK